MRSEIAALEGALRRRADEIVGLVSANQALRVRAATLDLMVKIQQEISRHKKDIGLGAEGGQEVEDELELLRAGLSAPITPSSCSCGGEAAAAPPAAGVRAADCAIGGGGGSGGDAAPSSPPGASRNGSQCSDSGSRSGLMAHLPHLERWSSVLGLEW